VFVWSCLSRYARCLFLPWLAASMGWLVETELTNCRAVPVPRATLASFPSHCLFLTSTSTSTSTFCATLLLVKSCTPSFCRVVHLQSLATSVISYLLETVRRVYTQVLRVTRLLEPTVVETPNNILLCAISLEHILHRIPLCLNSHCATSTPAVSKPAPTTKSQVSLGPEQTEHLC
jgi:hypothetical protein